MIFAKDEAKKKKGNYVLFDKEFEKELVKRKKNYSSTGKYVHLISGDEKKYKGEKLFIRQSAMKLIATYDNTGFYALRSVFIATILKSSDNIKYFLGIINSKLLTFFALKSGIIIYQKGKQPQIRIAGIKQLPICVASKSQYSGMIQLVDQMLTTQKKLHKTNSPIEKNQYQKEINILDNQIDNLVYKLYELTSEEIKIVEGST